MHLSETYFLHRKFCQKQSNMVESRTRVIVEIRITINRIMCNQPRKVVHPELCGKFLISLVSITQTKSAAVTKCAVSYRFIVTHVSKNKN